MWEPELCLICELRWLEWLIKCDMLWFTGDRRWCVESYVLYQEWLIIFCMVCLDCLDMTIQYGLWSRIHSITCVSYGLQYKETTYPRFCFVFCFVFAICCFLLFFIREIPASPFRFLSICCTTPHKCGELWIAAINLVNTMTCHLVIQPRHTLSSDMQQRCM